MLFAASFLYLTSLPALFYTADAKSSYTFGQACSQAQSKLAHGTYQLNTKCGPTMYCAANSTCAEKGCRRDEYPLGYGSKDLPPKCGHSTFCPDEEDACQPLLPVGSPCQLNRDDECEPPPNASQFAGPRNHNGSVCLNFQCMWANATLGSTCVVENVPYIVYDQNTGSQYINIVSRDNCKNGMYCDGVQKLCINVLAVGASCTADKECTSLNCDLSGHCGMPASTVKHVSTWVYAVVGAGIVGSMLAVLITLFLIHRRSREAEQVKRAQYWREQESMRNNILSMREQARASLLSLPLQTGNNSPRGEFRDQDYPPSETSQTGMLYAAAKASGLRNNYSDDNDADSMEEALVHPSSQDEDDYHQHSRQRRPPGRV